MFLALFFRHGRCVLHENFVQNRYVFRLFCLCYSFVDNNFFIDCNFHDWQVHNRWRHCSFFSLDLPLGCLLSHWAGVATYLTTGRWKKIKEASSKKRKWVGVVTNVYLRKMLEKPKRGLRILKRRVRELFTHREGISTPRARHKGWQPLIECVQRDSKIMYFLKSVEFILLHYFIFYFILSESIRVLPLLLCIPMCDGETRPM